MLVWSHAVPVILAFSTVQQTMERGKRVADAGRAPKFVGISGKCLRGAGNQVLGDESFQKVFLNEEEQVSYLKDTPRAAFEASTQL
jgi:hypothetical protein